jgi:hypothetical protein
MFVCSVCVFRRAVVVGGMYCSELIVPTTKHCAVERVWGEWNQRSSHSETYSYRYRYVYVFCYEVCSVSANNNILTGN